MGVTRALALAGVVDFRWVDEEAKFRGSEIHRIVQLATLGALSQKSVPKALRGWRSSHTTFMRETGFIAQFVEVPLEDYRIGLRGRLDVSGLMNGQRTVCDFKTGSVAPATALQLCLYGFMLDPTCWWRRIAVKLMNHDKYSLKQYPKTAWATDLATAFACVKKAQGHASVLDEARIDSWKRANKVS